MAQRSEAVVLGPQIGKSSPPFGEGQVRADTFGHHVPPSILTGEHGAEGAVGDELGRRGDRQGKRERYVATAFVS